MSKQLEYVAEWLEAGAPHEKGGMAFNMDNWHEKVHGMEKFKQPWIGECGSVACIGGAIEWFFNINGEVNPEKLGLTSDQSRDLFYPWWSASYRKGSRHLSPQNCAKVIRNLLKTGEVDWSII